MIAAAYHCLAEAPSWMSVCRRLAFPGLTNWLRARRALIFLAVRPYTMLSRARLNALYDLADRTHHEGILGAFVECGAWKGGSSALLARRGMGRPMWVFDSFQGCPTPGAEDISFKGRLGEAGEAQAEERHLWEIAGKLGVSDRMRVVPGWFADTIPATASAIGSVALLHLDADWYESTKVCLQHLYPKVASGGYVVVDDYGYWTGCRKAVDEHLATLPERPAIHRTDHTGIYWRKP